MTANLYTTFRGSFTKIKTPVQKKKVRFKINTDNYDKVIRVREMTLDLILNR